MAAQLAGGSPPADVKRAGRSMAIGAVTGPDRRQSAREGLPMIRADAIQRGVLTSRTRHEYKRNNMPGRSRRAVHSDAGRNVRIHYGDLCASDGPRGCAAAYQIE